MKIRMYKIESQCSDVNKLSIKVQGNCKMPPMIATRKCPFSNSDESFFRMAILETKEKDISALNFGQK